MLRQKIYILYTYKVLEPCK